MSRIEQVTRHIRTGAAGLCDACIAAELALPNRQARLAAIMLGKARGHARLRGRCPRCAGARWITRRAA